MALKIKKDDLDFVSSSILAGIMTPVLISIGVLGDWETFFGVLMCTAFIYLVLLFSNVLHDKT